MRTIFSWNEDKNKLNQKKHGLSFESAQGVFNDPTIISWLDNYSHEERWISLGFLNDNIIVIIHTEEYRNGQEKIRIISARKANKKEEEKYYATIGASKK